MKNNNVQKKHVRGSSSLQGTGKQPDDSAILTVFKRINRSNEPPTDISGSQSKDWARGNLPIWANQKKSQPEDQEKELTSQNHGIESPPEDERWQDDGGESGEVV